MNKNYKAILLFIVIFVLLLMLQIYSSGLFFQKPIIDFLLLFLILLIFSAPPWLIFIFVFIRGVIFDSLSGIGWGIHLGSLLLTFVLGYYLLRHIISETLFARLLVGILMLIFYFFSFEILNLLWFQHNFDFLIIINLLINITIYVISILFYDKIQTQYHKKKY